MTKDKSVNSPGLLLFYNAIQLASLPLLLPTLTAVCLAKEKYRKQFLTRMGRLDKQAPTKKALKRIWIHAMSLGEFNAARPFISGVKKRFPGAGIILSASTASGLSALKKNPLSKGATITALPFDFLPVVSHAVKVLQPSCFLLIETDIWPNLLWRLKRLQIPSILVNGSISEQSAKRLERLPFVSRFLYGPFSMLAMQSDDDVSRLLRLGLKKGNIKSCGNLKFDYQPKEISQEEKARLFNATGFEQGSLIIAAGSTHPGEEAVIAEAFAKVKGAFQNCRLLLAPRDIKRAQEISLIFKERGLSCAFRSKHPDQTGLQGHHHVFILDTLGELERFYSLAHIAFVGGSLVPVGGHNLLEPAVFGIPVIFGPYMESFRQTADTFVQSGAGFQIDDARQLTQTLLWLLSDKKARDKAGFSGLSLLEANRGVTDKYLDIVTPFLAQ